MDEILLNRSENILKLNENQSYQAPLLSNNFMVDKIMTEIRLSGHLDDILSIIQKVEKRFPKYSDTFWYRFALPGPFLLVRSIEDEFNQNSNTKKLFKYLDWDKKEIAISNAIYITTFFLGITTIIALKFAIIDGFFKGLLVVPLFGLFIFFQLRFFAHTISYIGFVQIYKQICDVLESHYRKHCEYVENVIEFPQQVQKRWQEMEKNKIFDSMNAAEKKHRQEIELKTAQNLQDLAAIVAIHQASTEAKIETIKKKTQLRYRAAELKIFDQIDEKKRRHELALSAVESMGRSLVEKSKAVANDNQERQKIEYQLHLLNGIRGKLQSNGSAAMSDETIYESINKMMEMMINPESTSGGTP